MILVPELPLQHTAMAVSVNRGWAVIVSPRNCKAYFLA